VSRWIVAASVAITIGTGRAAAAPPDPNARYKELVAAYAAGGRAAAVAGIGTLDDDALRAGVESVRGYPARLLRAALMLHTDRRLLEERSADTETAPGCESAQTDPAWRTAQHLMLHVDSLDFVRRWSIAVALQDQWDGCFTHAHRWIDAGARWFADDPEVALARGAMYETLATLPSRAPRPFDTSRSGARKAGLFAVAIRARLLNEARRSLERAVALDSAAERARLRLGRVLWHLGKREEAAAALDGVLARSRDEDVRHLAHLFRARLHQDAGQAEWALRDYRAALALQPESQAAAMGLADALQLAGEPEAARTVVEAALATAGRRHARQAFWEYRFADARRALGLLDALRDEAGP
jgi:tetratricopeptide (TPR) repeat protein